MMRQAAALLLMVAVPARALGAEDAPGAAFAMVGFFPPVPKVSPIPPDPVRACDQGRCKLLSRRAAIESGYTVVDLSDHWAPAIFQDGEKNGRTLVNTFRQRFLDLANERTDHDGDPLDRGEQNFLDLYGIPPSLSLIRKRWRGDREQDCWDDIAYDAIAAFEGKIVFRGTKTGWLERRRRLNRQLRAALKRHKVADAEALAAAAPGKYDKLIRNLVEAEIRFKAGTEVQKRLKCERLVHRRYKVKPGWEDWATHGGVARFEKKHMIFGWGHLRGDTTVAMALPQEVLNHRSLLRAIGERVADAAGLIEDGSVEGTPDLVGQAKEAFATALGIDTPAKAFDWLDRQVSFDKISVGAKLPAPPAYHSRHMDLRLVVNRGDVWYDFPYTEEGERRRQKVKNRPRVVLAVQHEGEWHPLVSWRTTIGSWRKELVRDGYVYLKYKNSDIGPRVMRHIIAGPAWIPPESTPLNELVKRKRNKATREKEWVVNYDTMGPGYKSAYGLVAGYLIEEKCRGEGEDKKCWKRDHGIRIHGTADYMSIIARFSHGCHRLYNHRAIRLYDFMLKHRDHRTIGQTVLQYEREFEHAPKDVEEPLPFKVELPSRGFRYALDPPLPVIVMKGRVMGKQEEPIAEYLRIPNKEYAVDAWIPEEGGSGDVPPVEATGADSGLEGGPPPEGAAPSPTSLPAGAPPATGPAASADPPQAPSPATAEPQAP